MKGSWHTARVVLGGILALAVAMGIGRFAYTLVLPMMLNEGVIAEAGAGYLASANYVGYFVGALCTLIFAQKKYEYRFVILGLLVSIVTTAIMGIIDSYAIWLWIRFISGFASAYVFVYASNLVIDSLVPEEKQVWSGIFYGGVGLGIFFSCLTQLSIDWEGGWRGAWLGLAFGGAILMLPLPYFFRRIKVGTPALIAAALEAEHPQAKRHPSLLVWLIAAYGLEGLGYIVSGTFLVAQSESLTGNSSFAVYVWGIAGLAAVPSCLIWAYAARRWGHAAVTVLAFLMQAAGIILPILLPSTLGIIIGGFTFGFTFMGIVTLIISRSKLLLRKAGRRIIGILTSAYALGQIIGPAVAGQWIADSGSYSSAAIGAAAVIFLGAVLLTIGNLIHHLSIREEA